MTEYGTVN